LAKVTKVKLKLKTHKGAAKRFKITGSGKVMRHHAFARHILTSKASKRKRRLGTDTELSPSNVAQVKRMLPYGN
jgi:large subunit ribosomal protein L35